jgi:hypothetical protein
LKLWFYQLIFMSKNKLAKDKLLIVFLVVLGIGTLWLGFSNINSKIKGTVGDNNSKGDNLNEEKLTSEAIIKLKNTDTDKDELSDYDELNVYHTSIYLADSDSDGFSDKEEVASGHDPNCPKGKNCSIVSGDDNPEFNKIEETLLNDYLGSGNGSMDTQAAIDAERIFSGKATIEEVKALLVTQGMSRAELDKIPNQEIMKMYEDMLKNSGYVGSSTGDQSSLDAERILSGQATAGEVRDLLITQGMSGAELDQVSDQEIMKMYKEMLVNISQ